MASSTPPRRWGFIGTGLMGEPMAANLLTAGHDVTIWNRSDAAARRLQDLGAHRAADPLQVIAGCDATIEMLASAEVSEELLRPSSRAFAAAVRGRGVVHMSTTAPSFSEHLGRCVAAGGGWYVEAPVSGSREPARQGVLVAMTAGPGDRLTAVQPALSAMCAVVLPCGVPPAATRMKLAVNLFLITLVSGLAEAWHFAQNTGLDPAVFARTIASGQMSSPIAQAKLAKLLDDDLSAQAALADVWKNSDLIVAEAQAGGIAAPLITRCHQLFRQAIDLGYAESDMIGVTKALEHLDRSEAPPVPEKATGTTT